jgi:putative peptidoglycan lipid II flippase
MSKQLLKATTVVSSMTLISRILGFVREVIAARYFGADANYDAFVIASKIPNFLRRLFAEGAFAQAFVPVLSEYRHQRTHAEVQCFVNRVAGTLIGILFGVMLLGMLCAPGIISLFAPGFLRTAGGVRFTLASTMLRITFPYLILISLTAFAGSILNSFGRFASPAFTPVFLNIALIIAAVTLSPYFEVPVLALAWGILLGGILQLGFQWPFLKQVALLPKFQWGWQDPGVKRILCLMTPALLGVSVNQLNLMLSSVFASFLTVGSISWLNYAERLMEFPLGGFGVALATVVLPNLAKHYSQQRAEIFGATLDWGIRWVLLIGMPAALGLGLLAEPLLTTLFCYGRFTAYDVSMSAPCLQAYAIGILGFMLVKIVASAYYARQDIKTPVRFAMMTVALNALLSVIFIHYWNHVGVALATACASLGNASLLLWGLKKRQMIYWQPAWGKFALQLGSACLALWGMIAYLQVPVATWVDWNMQARILRLLLLIASAGLVYMGVLFLTGLRLKHMLVQISE